MNKIIVKIANQEYTIIGDEEKDYILSLASHVDEQIATASSKTQKLNTLTPVILASINITDQYFKSEEMVKKLTDQVKNSEFYNDSCQEEQSQLILAQEKKIKELEGVLNLQHSQNQYKEDSELRDIMVEQENEILELNKLINSFQNHIYELQLELNRLSDVK